MGAEGLAASPAVASAEEGGREASSKSGAIGPSLSKPALLGSGPPGVRGRLKMAVPGHHDDTTHQQHAEREKFRTRTFVCDGGPAL